MAKTTKKPAKKTPKKAPAKKKTASKKTSSNKVGRPPVITDKVVQKLEKAFIAGLSDREACLYAGAAESTFYDYCNANPEFSERKELLKKTPVLNSKMTIARAVKKDPAMALKLLERKERKEWAPPTVKQDVHLTNEVGDKTDEQLDDELAALEEELAKRGGSES